MSESGVRLEFEFVPESWAAQRNFDTLAAMELGRGPAQARVYNNANISIADNTVTALTFNTERWDTGNFHSTATNTGRLTAPTAGLYSIGACVKWGGNATGVRWIAVRLNGTTYIVRNDIDIDSATEHVQAIHTDYQLAAADYVEVVVVQNCGAPLNVISTGNFSPEFWIHRIGSQA